LTTGFVPSAAAFRVTDGQMSVTSGTLPTGMTIDSVDGLVTGVPRSAGQFAVTLAVSNARGALTPLALTLDVAPRLSIVTAHLARTAVGRAYGTKVAVHGGVGPVQWTVVRGALPQGIRIDRQSGALAGTPRRAGTFRFTVSAKDALGASSRRTFVLSVRA
jgi:hypothetical protein